MNAVLQNDVVLPSISSFLTKQIFAHRLPMARVRSFEQFWSVFLEPASKMDGAGFCFIKISVCLNL